MYQVKAKIILRIFFEFFLPFQAYGEPSVREKVDLIHKFNIQIDIRRKIIHKYLLRKTNRQIGIVVGNRVHLKYYYG